MSRVARLRERLPDLGADSLLVTNATNVRYLTGFQSSNAALLVAATRSILLTDGRYLEAAGTIPDVEVVETTHEAPGDLAGRLRELATGRVGFEAAHVSVSRHARLAASGVELVPVEGAVERLRAVKDAGELAAIRASAQILDQAYERLALEPVVGRTEAELAWWMESTLRDLGADDVSFDPIVASGPNAARDPITIRTAVASSPARRFSSTPAASSTATAPTARERSRQAPCRRSSSAPTRCVSTRSSRRSRRCDTAPACVEVDAIARQILADEGYTVFHNVGHAVGLEIHEDPRLAKGSTDILEAGNVVTVEPGDLPAGPRRDQDRGPRDRHRRRPGGADAVHEGAAPHGPGIGPDEVATARR